ncbi:MAG: type II toxin-antitoxin system VapC family toxin [Nanoarchaeota archaeon]|nr:type II toxin-antitoxin system VapC family toxin [Nanoarchaeota archaeon]MBU1501640.1 type II toxin-antitoxin system VapC family toxin [Nanoarchaeota archaeon]
MIYLDANIFILSILDNKEKGEHCRKLLRNAASGKVVAFTSVLTWDEVVHSLGKYTSPKILREQSCKFLRFPKLIFLKTDLEILEKAEELRTCYGLKPRDAIHAATAIINKIPKIASDDTDFDKVKELKRVKI